MLAFRFLAHFAQEDFVCLLHSNNFIFDSYGEYEWIAAAGIAKKYMPEFSDDAFAELEKFNKENSDWKFGFLSYDLKNQIENLHSENTCTIQFPLMQFVIPQVLLVKHKSGKLQMGMYQNNDFHVVSELFEQIEKAEIQSSSLQSIELKTRTTKKEYIQHVNSLLRYIQRGDIYEANYCQEFFAEDVTINPIQVFYSLMQLSPNPFSAFLKTGDKYILSASPERFLKKKGLQLISQPIKGTVKRGKSIEEDEHQKQVLLQSEKNRAENVMIVDLVRNDLSHFASKASVKVEELFGLYSFPQVHHLISTVSCLLQKDSDTWQAVKKAYPMGSMTGAPKVSAMQLIEQHEDFARGVFSGSIGYIDTEDNFDFNVVIRSIFYDASKKYLSCPVGGAITHYSQAEDEYQECLHKIEGMLASLRGENK
jgi:para-aminobenzoate synthetase component 1